MRKAQEARTIPRMVRHGHRVLSAAIGLLQFYKTFADFCEVDCSNLP